jgi:hypothetical protein
MSTLWKNNSTVIQLHVDGTCLDDPGHVAEAFAKHFYTTCSHTSPQPSPVTVSYSDFLLLVSVSEYDSQKQLKDSQTNTISWS